jgi:2-C-methyl-D-erythritol 2,4-cyclodiphosphate synthase
VLHALCDALLGAAALGDIGELFPDTDPRYLRINSEALLADVLARVRQLGWEIVNVDLVIHAEQPKLAPYKPQIRRNIARILGVDGSQVNVKAKTGEGVGPIGRGEAISCETVVLIDKQ